MWLPSLWHTLCSVPCLSISTLKTRVACVTKTKNVFGAQDEGVAAAPLFLYRSLYIPDSSPPAPAPPLAHPPSVRNARLELLLHYFFSIALSMPLTRLLPLLLLLPLFPILPPSVGQFAPVVHGPRPDPGPQPRVESGLLGLDLSSAQNPASSVAHQRLRFARGDQPHYHTSAHSGHLHGSHRRPSLSTLEQSWRPHHVAATTRGSRSTL